MTNTYVGNGSLFIFLNF